MLIAVIGQGWGARGGRERSPPARRARQLVRLEVGGALRRNIRVIPVLGGAEVPTAEELPDDLAGLARRNGLVMSDLDWSSGAQKLFTTIERVLGTLQTTPEPP